MRTCQENFRLDAKYLKSHQINNPIQAFFHIKLGSNKYYFNYVVCNMKCGILVSLYYHTLIFISQIVSPTTTHCGPHAANNFTWMPYGQDFPKMLCKINVNPQKNRLFHNLIKTSTLSLALCSLENAFNVTLNIKLL